MRFTLSRDIYLTPDPYYFVLEEALGIWAQVYLNIPISIK